MLSVPHSGYPSLHRHPHICMLSGGSKLAIGVDVNMSWCLSRAPKTAAVETDDGWMEVVTLSLKAVVSHSFPSDYLQSRRR